MLAVESEDAADEPAEPAAEPAVEPAEPAAEPAEPAAELVIEPAEPAEPPSSMSPPSALSSSPSSPSELRIVEATLLTTKCALGLRRKLEAERSASAAAFMPCDTVPFGYGNRYGTRPQLLKGPWSWLSRHVFHTRL